MSVFSLWTATLLNDLGKVFRIFFFHGVCLLLFRYLAAVEAKKKRQTKVVFGPRDKKRLNPKQESTMWVALVEHLLANDELPVVAFTLSRKRCDLNANALDKDLTDAREKSRIRNFFKQSVARLNQSDRQLPQVRNCEISFSLRFTLFLFILIFF